MWFIRIGSKVEGPYSHEKLCELRKLQKFSRHHQISLDRVRWESAAQLIISIDATLSGGPSPATTATATATRTTATSTTHTSSVSNWYYSSAGGQTSGPVAASQIRQLIESGRLRTSSQVCREGEQTWQPLDSVAEFRDAAFRPTLKPIVIAAVTAIGLLLLAALATSAFSGSRIKDAFSSVVHWISGDSSGTQSDGQLLVTSVKDRSKFPSAVGLVFTSIRRINPDGAPGKRIKCSTGSAFAITPDGYLLTNRHVAVDGTPDGAKKSFLEALGDQLEAHTKALAAATAPDDVKELQIRIALYKRWIANVQPASVSLEPRLSVFFDGIRFETEIKYLSDRYDLAILKVKQTRDMPYFSLSLKNEVAGGEELVILGFPGVANRARTTADKALEIVNQDQFDEPEKQLLAHHFKYSQTQGFASRSVADAGGLWTIEHNVPTYHGNSGGPVLLSDGTVAGINSAGVSDSGGGATLFLAYPVAQFRKEIDQFVPKGIVWK